MNFAFVLGLLVVIGGFAKSFIQAQVETTTQAKPNISQTSTGKQSANIVGGGDVNLNFGDGTLSQQKKNTPEQAATPLPENVQQQSAGEQSPNVIAPGDVNIKH